MSAFFRVEKNGKGPYSGRESIVQYLSDKKVITGALPVEYVAARPVPTADFGLSAAWEKMDKETQRGYVFGFSKFDDIFNWFNLAEEIEFFKKEEFVIVKYETYDIIKGSKQAIAWEASLEFVESITF